MDYAELVKKLRSECALPFATLQTMRDAADAIEELQKRVPPVPHGRLIDADEYKQEMKDCQMAFWDEVLDSMPTIIPAEEDE